MRIKHSNNDTTSGCAIIIWLFFAICWLINAVKLVKCDFDAPYKEEIIHAIGLLVPPASIVTAWF